MKITNIEKYKGTRHIVYVDDEYWYILDIEIIASNGLKAGLECDKDFLENIKYKAEIRKAKERALYLLSYRDHSKSELIKKLEKNVSEQVAVLTAEKMQEFGYLDDEKYAEKLAKDLILRKKLGYRRALYQMTLKGLDKDLCEEVLEELENDPVEIIEKLVEKKYAKYLVDQKGKNKVINALLRLGHNYSDIKVVIDEYMDEVDY